MMTDMDSYTSMLSIVWSVIGLGYCSYGRKASPYYLIAGIILLVFPYFVGSFWATLGLGLLCLVLPYLLDR